MQSDYFLTGSISEFNEDIRNRNWGLSLGGNLFHKLTGADVSGQDSIISVAMDMRIVSSKSGSVLRNSQGELLAASLNNNIVTKQYNGSLFRIFGEGNANGNFGVKISDPRHLAIREIVEAGTLMLLGKLYEVPWEQCFNQQQFSALKTLDPVDGQGW
jgi:curli biogenesis system outer membrane secretion channel CsgG